MLGRAHASNGCRCAILFVIAAPYVIARTVMSKAEGDASFSLASSTLATSGLMRRAENPFAFLTGLSAVLSINFLQVLRVACQ